MSHPLVEWIKQQPVMNTTSTDFYPSITKDASGNIYVTYYSYGTVSGGSSAGDADIVVFKMNTSGSLIWIKQHQAMNTNQTDAGPTIALDALGNVFVSYYSNSTVSGGTNLGNQDIVVFKLDTNGNLLWVKQQDTMNTSGNDMYPAITTDISGNCYVSYISDGTVSGGTKLSGSNTLAIFKLDIDGNMVWIKDFSAINGENAYIQNPSLTSDTSGNVFISYWIGGGSVSGGTNVGGYWDIAVAKLDSDGNCVWVKQTSPMNTTGSEFNPSIAIDASGNIYVGYATTGAASGGSNVFGYDIIVFKMDSNGDVVWVKQPSSLNTDTGGDNYIKIAVDSSGNVYITYQSSGTISGGTKYANETVVAAKMDTNGNVVWSIQDGFINTTSANYSPAITVDTNNNVFLTYWTAGTVSGGTSDGPPDIIVAKIIESTQQIVPYISAAESDKYNNKGLSIKWINKNGADSIKVYRDTQSSGATKTLITTTSGYNYSDYPASNGQYYYFVSAMYGASETALSPPFSVNYQKPEYSIEWIKQTANMQTQNGINADFANSIVADADGNVYVTYMGGGSVSGGAQVGYPDIIVFKMDKNGNLLWIKQSDIVNTPAYQYYPTIALDVSGNIYLAYSSGGSVSGGTNLGSFDNVVCKMDNNGNVVWVKQVPAYNSPDIDFYPKIVVDTLGNSYVAFATYGTISGGTKPSPFNMAIFKLDSNGNVVWIKQDALIQSDNYSMYPSIAISASGFLHIAYSTYGTVSGGTYLGGQNIVVIKMNTNGNVIWIKQDASFNNASSNQYPVVAVDGSDNVYVSFYTNGQVSGGTLVGQQDIAVFKLDSSGNTLWIRQPAQINTNVDEYYPSIALDSAGNVLLSYTSNGIVSGGTNFSGINAPVLCKLDTNGNVVWVKEEGILNVIASDQNVNTNKQVFITLDGSDALYVVYATIRTVSGGTQINNNNWYPVVARYSAGPSVPGKPTSVSAAPGVGQATVSFNAPANDGGSAITNYTVTSSPGGFTASGASSPITVTGLTNGTAYTFTVTATNSLGTGQPSNASVPVTPNNVPDAPTGVTASPASLCALVSWTKPANNGGAAITNYTVTSSPGGLTGTVNGADNTSCYVYGLTNNVAYTFTVTATNIIGTSAPSSASSAVTPIADAPTTAVTDAIATNDTVTITNYVNSASTATPTDTANLSIDMRTSLNAGTVGATTQQKVDTKLAYIDSMRSKVGADNFTVPQAQFTEFIQTFKTLADQTLTPKPIVAYVPSYTATTATVNVANSSSSSYFMVEVPIGYTVILQNGANSISLTYNGTNYSDGTNTYTTGSIIVLGTKTLTLIGIGSGGFDTQDQSTVVCITKGSMIQTPSGEVPIETLVRGDFVLTGDGRKVQIRKMKQIVVVAANEINAPYLIDKNAFGHGSPPNRLEVSPRHAIQLPNGLWDIPCEAAKVNSKVYQNKDTIGKQVVYYHFSLSNYATDTTIVNGQPTECLNDCEFKESYGWNEAKQGYVRTLQPFQKNIMKKH